MFAPNIWSENEMAGRRERERERERKKERGMGRGARKRLHSRPHGVHFTDPYFRRRPIFVYSKFKHMFESSRDFVKAVLLCNPWYYHRWNSNIEPQGRYFIFHQQVFSNIAFLFASWCYVTTCSVIQVEWFSQIRKLYLTSFKGTH